ncbi:MAG TPA: copper amine oxidase N-terminal domain-containing protein, partial [Methanobacterium sp.]|nr:copper amine oxidase N-terminal domain-containing protein [Methanobacterium sp.]
VHRQSWPIIPINLGDKEFQGFIINNTTYAPVRALVESLGHQVEWNNGLNAILIPPVTIKIPPQGNNKIRIATRSVIIPGELINNQAYAPVRHLCEALGYKVTWDTEKRIIIIE